MTLEQQAWGAVGTAAKFPFTHIPSVVCYFKHRLSGPYWVCKGGYTWLGGRCEEVLLSPGDRCQF